MARLLTVRNSSQRPTRLKLRVLAGKFSAFTSRRLSPVVVGLSGDGGGGGGGGGGGSTVCDSDSDHDNDLLSNSLEKSLGTDPCLEDTDSDSMVDGWEYYAAKDLNRKAVPYPGKRPYPNALDPSDGKAGVGERLGLRRRRPQDLRGVPRLAPSPAARSTPPRSAGSDAASPLGYSDGTKTSRPSETPVVPSWRSSAYGLSNPAESFPAEYDFHGDLAWHDDERDADADGLGELPRGRPRARARVLVGRLLGPAYIAAAWPDPANPWHRATRSSSAPSTSVPTPTLDLDRLGRRRRHAARRRGRPGLRRLSRTSRSSTRPSGTTSTATARSSAGPRLPVAGRSGRERVQPLRAEHRRRGPAIDYQPLAVGPPPRPAPAPCASRVWALCLCASQRPASRTAQA